MPIGDVFGLINYSSGPSVWTTAPGPSPTGKNYDPNAPLSTLVQGTSQDPNVFGSELFKRKDPQRALQFSGDIAQTSGVSDIAAGKDVLGVPLNFWQSLLKPPTRTSLTEQTGPALSALVGQYDTGRRALENLPRGGGTEATAAELPFQEAGATTNVIESALQNYINTLQPEAAKEIGAIGEFLTSTGLSEMGLGAQELVAAMEGKQASKNATLQLLGQLGQAAGTVAGAAIMAGSSG